MPELEIERGLRWALIGWSREKGLVFDATEGPDRDFVSRVEFCLNGPNDEQDPNKLKAVVAIKLKG